MKWAQIRDTSKQVEECHKRIKNFLEQNVHIKHIQQDIGQI